MKKLILMLVLLCASVAFAEAGNVRYPSGYRTNPDQEQIEFSGFVCTRVSLALAVNHKMNGPNMQTPARSGIRNNWDVEKAVAYVNAKADRGECFTVESAQVIPVQYGMERGERGEMVQIQSYVIVGRRGTFFTAFFG